MTIDKRDISAFIVLFLATIVCVRYFYKNMSDEQFVASVDPYSLVIPTPTAILAVNRPPVFKMLLPMENIRRAFSDHTPAIFLSVIRQNPDLSSFMIAYYPQGDVLYAPMDRHTAGHIFERLDAFFAFPAQQRMEEAVAVRYYPDVDKRFLGCYYHEGMLVASYNRGLLLKTVERQRACPARILPELADLIHKKGKGGAMNLFMQSDSLDLRIQVNDSTEWRMRDHWLAIDLFHSEEGLCGFYEQPHEKELENLYPLLCDTITTRINQLFPQIRATAQASHDEAAAYFSICVN